MFTHFFLAIFERADPSGLIFSCCKMVLYVMANIVFLVPFGQLCLLQSYVAWAEFCFSHCSQLACVAGVSGKGTTATQVILDWLHFSCS